MPKIVDEGRRVINNIERTAALFLVKNIFSFIMMLIAIVTVSTYPLKPVQISLVSSMMVGIPSFFLALAPNKNLVRGNFLANVLKSAMPAALTAVISNFYFGQGPWTPFQMFSWGIVGLIAGVFAPQLKKSLVFRIIYSAVSGVLYSLLMDIYTTLWYDGTFNLTRYIAAVTSAVPVTLTYVVSNVAFIIVLAKPIGSVHERIMTKYGMQ